MTDPRLVVVSAEDLRALIVSAVAEALATREGPAPPITSECLTTAQAAELLGLTRKALEAVRARGGGPPFLRIGRSVRYRREDLVRYAERPRNDSTPPPPLRPGIARDRRRA